MRTILTVVILLTGSQLRDQQCIDNDGDGWGSNGRISAAGNTIGMLLPTAH